MQAVGTQVRRQHETHVTQRHLPITTLTAQCTHLDQNRTGHEHRITHLQMTRHRLPQLASTIKAQVGGVSSHPLIDSLAGHTGQLRKHQVPRMIAARDATRRHRRHTTRNISRYDSLDVSQMARVVGEFTQTDAANQRQGRYVRHTLQVTTVSPGQLTSDLKRRAIETFLEFDSSR